MSAPNPQHLSNDPSVRIEQLAADPASRATDAEIAEARAEHQTSECEIDDGALKSVADDGLWVQAWVWLARPADDDDDSGDAS